MRLRIVALHLLPAQRILVVLRRGLWRGHAWRCSTGHPQAVELLPPFCNEAHGETAFAAAAHPPHCSRAITARCESQISHSVQVVLFEVCLVNAAFLDLVYWSARWHLFLLFFLFFLFFLFCSTLQ